MSLWIAVDEGAPHPLRSCAQIDRGRAPFVALEMAGAALRSEANQSLRAREARQTGPAGGSERHRCRCGPMLT